MISPPPRPQIPYFHGRSGRKPFRNLQRPRRLRGSGIAARRCRACGCFPVFLPVTNDLQISILVPPEASLVASGAEVAPRPTPGPSAAPPQKRRAGVGFGPSEPIGRLGCSWEAGQDRGASAYCELRVVFSDPPAAGPSTIAESSRQKNSLNRRQVQETC